MAVGGHNRPALRHRPTELQERVSCMRVLPLKDSLWGSLSRQRGRFLAIENPARTDDHGPDCSGPRKSGLIKRASAVKTSFSLA
ncbi:hypothetical protein CEXT_5511 [Caerostris extrusa]|uniref:Uncharacterized protein n=1 Tax=Caerostris extrusa TaxID=172846 RepID=A0AAV4XIX6_CAEEX|nr:hypothetical protein CEXT_5511 [Caerostris extrusa]